MTPPALPDPFESYGQPEFGAPAGPKFQWHKLLGCLRKFWWLPLGTLLLATLVAGVDAWFMPPSFTSYAQMWQTPKMQLPGNEMVSEDRENFAGTQIDVLQGSRIEEATLARLAEKGIKIPAGSPVDGFGQPHPVKVIVFLPPKSSIFQLQATGMDAVFTKAYLNTLMEVYMEKMKENRQTVTGIALASITDQVQKTDQDLKFEQDVLENFKRTNNLIVLQAEGASAGQYLVTLKTQLSDLQLQDRVLEATLNDPVISGTATNGSDASPFPPGLDSTAGASSGYATAYQSLQTLKLEREKLGKNLRPKHPKIIKLDEDISRSKSLLDVYVRESHDQLVAQQQNLRLKMDNIKASIKEWETKATKVNQLLVEADQQNQKVRRLQEVSDRLESLVQNVDISRNINQDTVSIYSPATDSRRYYSKQKKTMMMGAMAGLGLGLGLIGLLTFRDDRFHSVVEVNEKFGDSVIGQIPDVQVVEGKAPLLLDAGEDQYMLAESYRNLRSALLFMAVEGIRPKVMLITSALPHEGKSTVATNLAQALAMSGSRVMLVDCDLRRGVVHERMGLKHEPGLVEVLRGTAVLEQVIQNGPVTNLSYIARGKSSGESADIFLGVKFSQVLAWLREQFDYVLIDSSPVLATDDAPTLAPMMDGTVLVVRGSFTGAKQVTAALEQLTQRQAKILGVVFNRANTKASSYHYYKYEDYQPVKEA